MTFFGEERVIDTHIARLRKKVELAAGKPKFIQTIMGVGYKFEDLSPLAFNGLLVIRCQST
ncbi:MAG: helix-turn-helix domain-containing protein [Cyanobacteria bacterium P01_G01_bin.39]